MKQPDYNNQQSSFASRRPAQQYQQPNYSNYQPQPTMQGGNFAPRPFPQGQPSQMFGSNGQIYQASQQMHGYSDDFYNKYQQNLQKYQEMNQKMKEGISEADADANVEKMNELIDHINGSDDVPEVDAKTGNIPQLVNAVAFVCNCMNDPSIWLPPDQSKYAESIKGHCVKLSAALEKFKKMLAEMKGN